MEKINLTIAIAAYGEPKYLAQTIESVIKTQSVETRIIVVDDCSPTDCVKKICLEYLPRIEYFRNSSNLGISENFNNILSITKSKFVQILGHDDLLTSRIDDIIFENLAVINDCFAVQAGVIPIDKNGNRSKSITDVVKKLVSLRPEKVYSGKILRRSLMFGNWTYFPAIIWNLEAISGEQFAKEINYVQDLDLLLRMTKTKYGFMYSRTNAVSYRRHSNSESMSMNPIDRFREEKYVCYKNHESFDEKICSKILLLPRINFILGMTTRKLFK